MKVKIFILFMIFSFVVAFSGCAGSKIYLIDVKYLPEEKPPSLPALQTPEVVGICPFEDAREEKDKDTIGHRYRRDKYVDLLKVHGVSLSECVTQAVKDYFAKKGFKVTDCKGWDKTSEGLAHLPKDLFLVVGGKIESFRVKAQSGLITTETDYTVKIAASIGQMEKGQVVTQTIKSTFQTKKMRFDPDEVRYTLNRTLTEVIQKLFQDVQQDNAGP